MRSVNARFSVPISQLLTVLQIEIFLLRVPIQIQSKFQMYLNEKVDLIKQLILVFKSLLDGSKKIEVCT